ncbi:MAG: cation diffusion facilitator family transporter [Acutalibacteraceae bacterium]
MTKLLVKLFIKNSEDVKNPDVRERYGMLGSIVGIIVNLMLSLGKYIIGVISNSISITADAINNLADAGSCIVTLVSFKLSARKPDKNHPFGHGRIEYIAALIVGFIVELMGYELIKSSIEKIKSPEAVAFSIPALIVLILSVSGKVWLFVFNSTLGKKIDSPAMAAVAKDSLSDTIATGAAAVSLILSIFTDIPIDGYMGIIVSLFILYSGFGILKEAIGILLGMPPEKEDVDKLVDFIMSHEEIIGIHDLVIHSYGASRTFATVHAEISADENILKAHDTVDMIEHDVKKEFGIELVIHMDPVENNNELVIELNKTVRKIIAEISDELAIHDFRIVTGPTHTNIVFDVVVPYGFKYSNKQLKMMISDKIKEFNETYYAVITIDNSFV